VALPSWGVVLTSVLLLGSACDRPRPVKVADAPGAAGEAAPVAVAASPSVAGVEPARKIDALAPVKRVAWKLPSGPLSDSEKAVSGTWIAKVGDDATRSAFLADKLMFGFGEKKKGQDFIAATIEAIESDERMQTNCIWLELFADRTGIRRGCALIDGEPSALDKTDPFTGKKSDFGTRLQWYYDLPSKQVRIRFDDDMLVPAVGDGGSRFLRFRHWTLSFGKKAQSGFEMKEQVPEHDFSLPVQYIYEIFPGSFLGRQ
jgi:hypothetical protein